MKNIYYYFRQTCLRVKQSIEKHEVLNYLLSAILISLPLNFAFSSIATIVFIAIAFFSAKKIRFSFDIRLMLPVVFYFLMIVSLVWSRKPDLSFQGLQKELAFLFLPISFLFVDTLKNIKKELVFKIFSFGMVFHAVYYFANAIYRYDLSKDSAVFFYHELVTMDLSAIYVSVFASFAIFYFVAKKNKILIEKAALFVLVVLVFLLSSKSIITIDFILIVFYYSWFSTIPKYVRITTVLTVSSFLFFSLVFVKEVKERFLLEYETAFVDNTINNKIGNNSAKVFNVSLKQAWCNEKFQNNHFFPGTALRIYQVRVFGEMLNENHVFLTGFGLGASQDKIKEKGTEHNLYPFYGDLNFHNQYVQTFAELGVFGLIILMAMLFFNLKNGLKQKDFLHIAFAVTMIVLFLTESFLSRQRGILFFITLYCIFNSVAKPEEKKL